MTQHATNFLGIQGTAGEDTARMLFDATDGAVYLPGPGRITAQLTN